VHDSCPRIKDAPCSCMNSTCPSQSPTPSSQSLHVPNVHQKHPDPGTRCERRHLNGPAGHHPHPGLQRYRGCIRPLVGHCCSPPGIIRLHLFPGIPVSRTQAQEHVAMPPRHAGKRKVSAYQRASSETVLASKLLFHRYVLARLVYHHCGDRLRRRQDAQQPVLGAVPQRRAPALQARLPDISRHSYGELAHISVASVLQCRIPAGFLRAFVSSW